MSAHVHILRDIPVVQPVSVEVRELGYLTTLLLKDGDHTPEEAAYVKRCDEEAAASDPFFGMVSLPDAWGVGE